ncbi:MAG: ATP-binding protein, partial [Methylocella sp.]
AMANLVKDTGAIRVEFVVAPPGPLEDSRRPAFLVLGHGPRLGQVFNNLIDNARSFSAADGSVRMLLRPTKAHTAHGQTRDGFEIIVDDDGPGIPADAFERIFERFYTDRPGQGFGQNSGLGLSISRQIIEAHGGRISALNRIGPPGADGLNPVRGARFIIFLPKAR